MTTKVTVDGPCRRTLSFTIDRAQLDQEVASRLTEIAAKAAFKGFRRGKAPTALVERAHGASVREEARRQIMGRAFAEAVKEHGLHPVGDPEMNLEQLSDESDGPFTFEFAVEVAPEIDLQLPERFDVSVTLPTLEESMVDTEIDRLRERFGRIEDAPDEAPIAAEAILEGTAVYVVDGVELPPRSERPAFLKHELVDGLRIAGSAKLFSGAAKGDTIEVAVELPAHFDPPEHGGRSATLRYTIERHRVVTLPDLDESLLKSLGIGSVEELRDNIRTGLEGQRKAARTEQLSAAIEEQLLAAHTFEVPTRLEARSIDQRVHEVAHRLIEEQGLSDKDGHARAEEQREQIAAGTQRGLRLAFLYAHIAAAHELEASIDEAVGQVRAMAEKQGQDADATVQTSISEGWLGDVQEQLTNDKVRAWLRERAEVTEQTPPAADAG